MGATLSVAVVPRHLAHSSRADVQTSCAAASPARYEPDAGAGDAFKVVDAVPNTLYPEIPGEYLDDAVFTGESLFIPSPRSSPPLRGRGGLIRGFPAYFWIWRTRVRGRVAVTAAAALTSFPPLRGEVCKGGH